MKININKTLFTAGLLISIAMIITGCGGDNGSTYNNTDGTSSTVKVVSCPASGTVDVSIDNLSFSPAGVSVPANAVVKWSNLDSSTHTVTSTSTPSGGSFDIQVNPGASGCLNFTAAGSFSYYCSIHPSMTGSVTVQ